MSTTASTAAPAFFQTQDHMDYGLKDSVYHTSLDVSRQIGHTSNDISVAIEKIGAANTLATNVSYAATNLAIEKTHAATMLELFKCCCDQRDLTREEAGKTRDLINALNLKNIQDQLNDIKLQNAIAERRPMIPGI